MGSRRKTSGSALRMPAPGSDWAEALRLFNELIFILFAVVGGVTGQERKVDAHVRVAICFLDQGKKVVTILLVWYRNMKIAEMNPGNSSIHDRSSVPGYQRDAIMLANWLARTSWRVYSSGHFPLLPGDCSSCAERPCRSLLSKTEAGVDLL